MKKITFLAAVAAAAFAVGCSNDNTGGVVENEARAIEFRTVVDKGESRASILSSTQFNSFFIEATSGSAPSGFDFLSTAAYKESGSWTYSPKRYLPSNGDQVDFYAYAPIKDPLMSGFAVDNNTAKFTYTLPAAQNDVNNTSDLVVASAGIAQGAISGAVTLNFTHALSAVTFSGANTNDTSSELTYVVSEVAIANLLPVGTFTYPSTWAASGTAANFLAGIPASGVALVAAGGSATAKNLLSGNERMMVIPQIPTFATDTEITAALATPATAETTLAGKAYVKVTYSLKDGSGEVIVNNGVRYLAFPTTFATTGFVAGSRYNFAFGFETQMAGALPLVDIDFTVNLADWAAVVDVNVE